jgi:hypothetical protein
LPVPTLLPAWNGAAHLADDDAARADVLAAHTLTPRYWALLVRPLRDDP